MNPSTLRGAALGIVIDLAVGEPPASVPHPVAVLGRALGHVQARTERDSRAAGVLHAAAGIGLGALVGTATRSSAAATATCVAGKMLGDVALGIGRDLDAGDLAAARLALPSLVGRDPDALDAGAIARAVVESVAENTVDAVVAPALWGAALGARGAWAHKAISTLDSTVGYRTDRYRNFGWASARLDDAAAWVPARATAGLVAAVRPDRAAAVWHTVRTDGPAHPSPNAGVAEAAFAAALGLRLGGPTPYAGGVEDRPTLGDGRAPVPTDIARAVTLARHVALALAAVLGAASIMGRR